MSLSSKRPMLHGNIAGLVKLLRPRQWIKNTFVLAPLIFAGEVTHFQPLISALVAAVLFCIASSATYIVNDLKDRESDRLHVVKRKSRPLAAGTVSPPQAITLLITLYGLLALGYFYESTVVGVILVYLVINVGYTYYLKHQPVIDIFIIAFGFVLRVYAGATAIDVPVSSWMFVTTLSIALYLASVKRRQELISAGTDSRKVLARYSVSLIDRYAEMSATGALLFYSLFVMNVQPELVITIPLVLYGLFRYWYVVEMEGGGESPTDALLADWQLLVTVLAWAGSCVYFLIPAGG